ncbi:MAG: hypothetical protein LBR83_02720 [Clostridiales bacterium]|jgi:septal ring factor EnvC (AmiA/AmiB activator)|nr:hypothetical protein [Clostridiales bacterium]
MNNDEKILSLLEKHSTLLEKHSALLETQSAVLEALLTEQQKTNQRLDKIENELVVVKSDVSEVKTELSEVKTELSKVETELADTKHHVILIEEDNKINHGALHDGYRQVYDIISKEIRPDIADIKAQYEKHELRLLRIEPDKKKSS